MIQTERVAGFVQNHIRHGQNVVAPGVPQLFVDERDVGPIVIAGVERAGDVQIVAGAADKHCRGSNVVHCQTEVPDNLNSEWGQIGLDCLNDLGNDRFAVSCVAIERRDGHPVALGIDIIKHIACPRAGPLTPAPGIELAAVIDAPSKFR